MQQIFKDAVVIDGNPLYSLSVNTEKSRTFGVQMVSKPDTITAESSATCILEGSNNKKDWMIISTIKTKSEAGTEENPSPYGTDGGPFEALWGFMRARITTTINCKVDVFLTKYEG